MKQMMIILVLYSQQLKFNYKICDTRSVVQIVRI